MKKFIHILLLIPVFLCISCNFSIKGEGKITSKEVKLQNIKQISAKGNCRLIYLFDNQKPRMIIETYGNLIDNLDIDNAGGQLSISESRTVQDTDLYNIYIYNPGIERFDIHDNVNVDINSQLRVSKLNISLSDNSKFLGSNVVVDELTVKATDASKINLQGTGTKLLLTVKNDSNFSAPFFEVSEAQIQLSNVATAELNVKNKLTGALTNNSELTLIGSPAKDLKQKDLAKITVKQ